MKSTPCEVIRDLLPLYIDGCCSGESRQLVEEHLEQCADCRRTWQEMTGQLPVPAPEEEAPPEELPEEKPARTMKKGLKKVRRRWIASIVIVALLIPLGKMGWNEFRGSGICFTNLNDLAIADAFMRDLKRGDYEAALEHWDLERLEESFLERWFEEETLADFDADAREQFLQSAQALTDAGGITDYRRTSVRWGSGGGNGTKGYQIVYLVTIGGETRELLLSVGNGGVYWMGDRDGFLSDPVPLTALGFWSELLWEHYEGCYFDFETREYVYYDQPAG
ncbi:MAG: zf-HC2 domain-containing protein [Oscillospiraceae bacterium]